jgi:hypothetical protein
LSDAAFAPRIRHSKSKPGDVPLVLLNPKKTSQMDAFIRLESDVEPALSEAEVPSSKSLFKTQRRRASAEARREMEKSRATKPFFFLLCGSLRFSAPLRLNHRFVGVAETPPSSGIKRAASPSAGLPSCRASALEF